MKTPLRIAAVAAAAVALLFLALAGNAPVQRASAQSTDPLTYPVILVHGLGEGPGEEAFGNLEQYLEDYYFDVEVLDFSQYANNQLAGEKTVGSLGNLAAVLGNKIKSVLTQYETTKVQIVAHSYGGLITQAYILNYGEEHDPKKGLYENDVEKVVYIQTPFYGTTYDADSLKQVVENTDYGPYTNVTRIMDSLELGSEEIFGMHNLLLDENAYEEDISALALVSTDDEIVTPLNGTLTSFMRMGYTHPFHRFLLFDGFAHCPSSISPASEGKSLAHVENINDKHFLTIASFLDNGIRWRKFGSTEIEQESIVMVKAEKDKSLKEITGDEVGLVLDEEYQTNGNVLRAKAKEETIAPFINEKSRVFVFQNLVPGKYTLTVSIKDEEDITVDIDFDPDDQVEVQGYRYVPKDHVLYRGSMRVGGKLSGIFTIDQVIFDQDDMEENSSYGFSDLDTDGFYIEFDVETVPSKYNKAILFSLYNADGYSSDWRWNGGRLEFTIRGSEYRYGILTIHINIDKNQDGFRDRNDDDLETIEAKTFDDWNWISRRHVRIEVQTLPDGRSRYRFYIDYALVTGWTNNGASVTELYKSGPYYNPNPVVSFGGRYHDDKYRNPTGTKIYNFVIANLK